MNSSNQINKILRTLTFVLLLAATLPVTADALTVGPGGPIAYSVNVTRDNDSNFESSYFATLNLATGASYQISPLQGPPEITSIAFQPKTGVLFGATDEVEDASGQDIGNNLITIDPDTGHVSIVGNLGVTIGEAFITFNSGGTLYLVGDLNESGRVTLLTVNPRTAKWTEIGPVGFPVLGITVANGKIYGITGTFGGDEGLPPSQLVEINSKTGAGSGVGPIDLPGIGFNLVSAGTSTDGTVYGLDSATGLVFTVNLVNGAGTTVTKVRPSQPPNDGFQGLAIPQIPPAVAIDIKPGSDRNSINPRSRGGINVAILSTNTADGDPLNFDALQIRPKTARFGPNKAKAIRYRVKDVDKDGDSDLIFRFRIPKTGIACGDTGADLTGKTWGGQAIVGTDSIRTVGCKNN